MRYLIPVFVLSAVLMWPGFASAQPAPPATPPAEFADLPYYLPITPPANLKPSAVPDLSGDWKSDNRPGRQTNSQSLSVADRGGAKRGKEGDIPYRPWAQEYTLKQYPPTGADAHFELTTDPYIHTCEPLGVGRIHNYPAKFRFIQTPEAVYILNEVGPQFRVVWLNAKHPDDPDPQYLGHSIGWYENGDTLVVDSIGFNDRTWLDQQGHPHTERLHFIERYKKVDKATLELTMTIDDPGAYTKAWQGNLNFTTSDTGFLRYQWVCSTRDNYEHYEKVGKAGNPGETSFK
jgi:hypothetical protein